MAWCRRGLSLGMFAALAACATSVGGEPELGENRHAIIYGEDDRREVFDHPDLGLRGLAEGSVVALIPHARFVRKSSGDLALASQVLEAAFEVCADERFATQPTAADCSGVLIDTDLVLTAGHCFGADASCERYAFVFDYFYTSAEQLEPGARASFGAGDVYGCRRVVARRVSTARDLMRIDYAVVQLDRSPAGRTPATIRAEPLAQGEPLATIGCVSGLPAKIDSGSHVLDPRAPNEDFFLLDSDTFEGSSGSGVFDAAARLVGVLVRGGQDYEPRPDAGCVVPKRVDLSADAGGLSSELGEEATYVARAVEETCARGWPSQRLCGIAPRCGDGFCTGDETRTLCPDDCSCLGDACNQPLQDAPAVAGSSVPKARTADADGMSCAARGGQAGAKELVLIALALAARRRRVRARRLL